MAALHLQWSGKMYKGLHEHEGAFAKMHKILRSRKQ